LVGILSVLAIVATSLYGINLFNVEKLEKNANPLAGGMILLCGLAIKFLGF
jgi:Mg2+ and Co2+ transporter CorA